VIRFFALSVIMLGGPALASAQTIVDRRAWLTTSFQGRQSRESPWRWSFDAIGRSREGVGSIDTMTFRPMVLYSVSSRTSIGGGYARVLMYPAAGGMLTENRVFGVYLWTGVARAGTMTMRVRVEDRMIESNSGMVWRVRPQARFSHPLQPGSRHALVGWDELSVNLNATTRLARGVDQNRAFGGVSTTWSPRFRTEVGYLNQFLPGHGNPDRMNHVFSTSLSVTF